MTKIVSKILVVDDDAAMREVLRIRLENWGFRVRLASDSSEASEIAESWDPDIILSDVVMPGASGLDLLKLLKGEDRDRPVILITAHGEVESAVEAMKDGAEDFLTKPINYDHLRAVLIEAQEKIGLRERVDQLKSRIEKGCDFGPFIGRSRSMQRVYGLIREVAATDASVLIAGPSGTGKELAAQTIHNLSSRGQAPFVPVNAAAIPTDLMESEIFGHEKGAFTGATESRPGCFEMANKGTLFLDEIGEMPVRLQAKLLRVLEDGRIRRLGSSREVHFDVRILAATNRDPGEAVAAGDLRQDLYFRLNVFTLELPALKTHASDIPALAQYFISHFNERHGTQVEGIREAVQERLVSYEWPGNVRELRNLIERATVLAKTSWIETSHLPPYMKQATRRQALKVVLPAGTSIADTEREMILKTLEMTDGNKAEAARRLGVDVKTIRNKLREYNSA